MAKTFRTIVDLHNYIEAACEEAIKETSEIMVQEFRNYIQEDFYNRYSPTFYDRTFSLLKSPTYNMLNKNSAEIFINFDVIHYLVGDPQYETTEEDIVRLAAQGYHGSPAIWRQGMFWEDFLQWCNKNVINLLKENLRKRGVNVK